MYYDVGFKKAGGGQANGNGSAQAAPSSAMQGGDIVADVGPISILQGG